MWIPVVFRKAKGPYATALAIFAVVAFFLLGMEPVMVILPLIGMVVVVIIMKPKITPEDKRRKSMIEIFPIPNSKEDLIEFAILAAGQIKKVNSLLCLFSLHAKRQKWLNGIWITKFNQVYSKARFAMKDDPSGLSAINQLMAEAGIKNKY